MGRVDDLAAFVRARLDEGGLPPRAIEALRAILEWHHPEWGDYVDGDGIERATHECAECEPPGTPDNWPCRTVRTVAAIWSDHPDYRAERKPLTAVSGPRTPGRPRPAPSRP